MFSILRSQKGRMRATAPRRVLIWLLLTLLVVIGIAAVIVSHV